jgi:trans-2,3-dihydro-3-hydroxyanthranilate isomerase
MPDYDFVTVDVFTDQLFGGNPLAVFPDARGLTDAQMQLLAKEFNYSETTFVLPPDDPAHTARVRIFTPATELPFAGHPNVGTGCVLAGMGRDTGGVLLFEELAGLVRVDVTRDAAGAVTGTVIAAPKPLALGTGFPVAGIAACAGLVAADIVTTAHAPVAGSVGTFFVMAETTSEALARATPDTAAFRQLEAATTDLGHRLALYLYCRDGARLRARMFYPLGGVPEDPATGSAATVLAALLLSLSDAQEGAWDILQGVEMGRPSLLRTTARRMADGIRATVGGNCVPVLRGVASL